MIEIAIVGLGSWGLSVLERTVSRARATGVEARVHVVQPGAPGGGVYSASQPDYLVLNNPCGQLSLYASPDGHDREYGLGLYDWAVRHGYRWVGYELRIDPAGKPIEKTDYLPRRVMGEYLSWFYETMVANTPKNLEVVRHIASALDIVAEADNRERVLLDDGSSLLVEHVIITSGHTINDEPQGDRVGVEYRRPYPVDYFHEKISPGAPVAIAGMGLVAYDLITALTLGRGGAYSDVGQRKCYVRSGREPMIHLYSRSGLPYLAKSAHGIDPTGEYRPIVCTPELFAQLRADDRRQIDFRTDLLPPLMAEMQCRYLTHSASVQGGRTAAQQVAATLRQRWEEGQFDKALEEFEPTYGSFDAERTVFGDEGRRYASSRDYEAYIYEMIETDLDHALDPNGSPIKAALEVTRILRDQLRSLIEFGGLSLESYVDFQSNMRGQINRIEAGPPALRSQQLLALLDAGVVRISLGPSPEVSATPDGRVVIRSTQLDRTHVTTVSHVVRGHLDMPSLARSASPLLHHLYAKGRLTQLTYGDTPVGSVAIDESFRPYNAEGRLQEGLSLLGVLTEGVRYFTHYLPSPQSRIRAVMDAQALVESVLG